MWTLLFPIISEAVTLRNTNVNITAVNYVAKSVQGQPRANMHVFSCTHNQTVRIIRYNNIQIYQIKQKNTRKVYNGN